MRHHWFMLGLALSACLEPALPALDDGALPVDAGPFVCSALTCTGCCLENVCFGGNHDDACGYSGRVCRLCSDDSRCETPGACFARPRDAGPIPTSFGLDAGLRSDVAQPCTLWLGRFFCG